MKWILLLLIAIPASAQISLLTGANGHGLCAFTGNSSCTTSPINATGATLLVILQSNFGGGVSVPPTSSPTACATWTALSTHFDGTTNSVVQIFYCFAPVTDPAQTFTCTGNYSGCWYLAFKGTKTDASVFIADNGAGASSSVTSLQTGSVTPSGTGNALVSIISSNVIYPSGLAIDSGFTILDSQTSPSTEDGADAYLIDSGSSSLNPTWSWTGAQAQIATAIAVFAPSPPSSGGQIGAFVVGP